MGGKITCTLGEVKNRADFIVYWGGNPAECHPRHFSKYTLTQKGKFVPEGRKGRTMVLVDIRDTGVGISEEDIKRIYDPFFTTKTTGKGTGLGLAVTYGIIQEHGGRIFVDSSPGTGTHFRLKLPTRQIH